LHEHLVGQLRRHLRIMSGWLGLRSSRSTAVSTISGTNKPRHTLTGHTDSVYALGVAADGTWLATAGYDGTVRIWDPHAGQARHTLTGHTNTVQAVGVAPDGTWLATAGKDQTVRIWDPHTGQARHTLTGHTNTVRAVAVAPDGTWLATAGDDRTVRIWDTGGEAIAALRTAAALSCLQSTSDSIIAAGDHGLYLLDAPRLCVTNPDTP
jgi:WD40 repeat protein